MEVKELIYIFQSIILIGTVAGFLYKMKNDIEKKLNREEFLTFRAEFVKKADTSQVDALERIVLTYIAENKELLRSIKDELKEMRERLHSYTISDKESR